jgi:hypothetical protein
MTRHASLASITFVAMLIGFAIPRTTSPKHAWSAPGSGDTSARSSRDIAAVMAAYEQVRSLLASDKIEGVATAARGLAGAARKARLEDIARFSLELAKAKDLGAARKAFGKLSRPMVALVQADPALKKRFHVFECPMVTAGENQWVQPTPTIQNPYMGKSMPTCGTKK